MKDLIQKTIARIRKEKMKPLPKWRFVLVDVAYWSLVVLAALFSAVAVAVGIYLLFQIDWEISRYAPGGALRTFFLYMPYAWLVVLISLLGVVYYFIRKTKEGYKYKWVVILLSFLTLAMAMGAVAYFARIGKIADDFAYSKVPYYRNLAPGMEHMWQRAEDGFLGGKIDSVEGNIISVTDFNGKRWSVFVSEKTVKRGPLELEKDVLIKIIGKVRKENGFDAEVIMSGMGRVRRDSNSDFPGREEFRRDFDGRGMRGDGRMMRGSGYRQE